MILPFETQVCDLELSNRLKELGFLQESMFMYLLPEGELMDWDEYKAPEIYCSAYTVAELGELLPGFVTANGINYAIAMWSVPNPEFKRIHGTWSINYKERVSRGKDWSWLRETIVEQSEANGRAKMLIYLKEQGLL